MNENLDTIDGFHSLVTDHVLMHVGLHITNCNAEKDRLYCVIY